MGQIITKPDLVLNPMFGFKKINLNLSHPRLLCSYTHPNKGRVGWATWKSHEIVIPKSEKIVNKRNHTNSLNRTRCLCYRYYNILFKPMDDMKEHFFFMGSITSIPKRWIMMSMEMNRWILGKMIIKWLKMRGMNSMSCKIF